MQALTLPRTGAGLRSRTCGPAAPTAPVRKSVVVRAAAHELDTRRQILGGLLAGIAILGGSQRALAIDIDDERNKSRMAGYDIIYEARELELPQEVRDGLKQARVDKSQTKFRVKESEKRIDNNLATYINKAYWTDAREELRLQLGTLRFDLGVLGEGLGKAQKKDVVDAKKTLFAAADRLDYAIRQKNKSDATEALSSVKSKLDVVLTKVL